MTGVSWGAADLFCGGGGASLGLDEAGFDVLAAIDNDPHACAAYEANVGKEPLEKDARDLSYAELLEHFGVDEEDVRLVAGCPPCQNFSSLRRTRPWPEGAPKDELLLTFLEFVEEGEPPVVLFENVPGILTTDDGKYIDYLLSELRGMGYSVVWDKVDAADYGVPQNRERVVAFAVQGVDESELALPPRTHAEPGTLDEFDLEEWESVKDTIADLPELEAGERCDDVDDHVARNHQEDTLELIRQVPEDGGSRSELPDGQWLDCHKELDRSAAGNVYGRMSWKDPAPTLTTRCTTPSCGRFLHPEQDRAITAREAARLQTFPDWYELPDKKKHAERIVGNAVPPDLIEALVEGFLEENPQVRDVLDGD